MTDRLLLDRLAARAWPPLVRVERDGWVQGAISASMQVEDGGAAARSLHDGAGSTRSHDDAYRRHP